MIGRSGTTLRDSNIDPHLVAGVVQVTLKDMQQSIFVHVYNDILDTGQSSK